MSLSKIPQEIVEAICFCLDALSLIRLGQVSRQLRRILTVSSALRYKIQLELAGMRDGRSLLASPVRLEILRVHQAAWANFNRTECDKTTVEMEGNLWELVGNVIATYHLPKGFSFTRIPSTIRQVPLAQWSIVDVPVVVRDFSMDLSQNLLLVVENNASKTVVHLLSMQTGLPHPLARTPSLSRRTDGLSPSSFQIRIFGDHVGVLAEDDEEEAVELLVWEWKIGKIKRHIRGAEITSFAFLDDRKLLMTVISADLQLELRVLDIDGDTTDMTGYFTFRLPVLSRPVEDLTDIHMMIQTEPPTSWTEEAQNQAFTVSHTNRLFVISLQRFEAFQDTDPTFMLCFLHSSLLRLMENPPDGKEDRIIVWDNWGPYNTRMFEVSQLPDPWVCFVHGQRCILYFNRVQGEILDFNPLYPSRKREIDERIVDEEGRLFSRPITTSAPFTSSWVDLYPCAAVMLAEDAIVAVSMSSWSVACAEILT